YPEAVAEYERSVAIDPKYAPAFNMLGYAHAAMGDFAKAVSCFERYAELDPGLPNPVDSIAEMNLFMGNLDESAAKYQAALALKPDFYSSCQGLAVVYALKEDYQEAERWLEEYRKRSPTPQVQVQAAYLRDYYDYLLGRLEQALSGFLALRNLCEKFGFDYGVAAVDYVTGNIYAEKGEFDKARKAFDGWRNYGLKASPANRATYLAQHGLVSAGIELRERRLASVRDRLAEVEKFLPDVAPAQREEIRSRALLLRAEAALAGNSVEEAIGTGEKIEFEVLKTVNPPDIIPYNSPFLKDVLARAYWKKGDLDKAIAEYERLTTIDPKNRLRFFIHPLYHYRFGRVLEEKGEKDEARVQYEKFLKYWADADPRFTELKDARARLAALKRTP
ncbi:MAG: tetratricopeptide repeat protein, partial [Candidatus Aminicenantales bacterium]